MLKTCAVVIAVTVAAAVAVYAYTTVRLHSSIRNLYS